MNDVPDVEVKELYATQQSLQATLKCLKTATDPTSIALHKQVNTQLKEVQHAITKAKPPKQQLQVLTAALNRKVADLKSTSDTIAAARTELGVLVDDYGIAAGNRYY